MTLYKGGIMLEIKCHFDIIILFLISFVISLIVESIQLNYIDDDDIYASLYYYVTIFIMNYLSD